MNLSVLGELRQKMKMRNTKKTCITIVGYGTKDSLDLFSRGINDCVASYSVNEHIKFYDILNKKYNESNPDCFKKPDKLSVNATPFAEKTYWGFSDSATKDAVYNASFAPLETKAVDYSIPYYKRGELVAALKRNDGPEDKRDIPDILRMEISYETTPLLDNYCFFRYTVWFFGKTIEDIKPFWFETVHSLDKSHGNCLHSSYLSDNPYPFSILHSDSFDNYDREVIADHILGIEKYTYLNYSLIKKLSQYISWDSSDVSFMDNGAVFSFASQSGLMNREEDLLKALRYILIPGYRSGPLNVMLTEKRHVSFPVTVCVLSERMCAQQGNPLYSVFLFYGSLSGEYIAENLPDNPLIIDMFKLD